MRSPSKPGSTHPLWCGKTTGATTRATQSTPPGWWCPFTNFFGLQHVRSCQTGHQFLPQSIWDNPNSSLHLRPLDHVTHLPMPFLSGHGSNGLDDGNVRLGLVRHRAQREGQVPLHHTHRFCAIRHQGRHLCLPLVCRNTLVYPLSIKNSMIINGHLG